jgi:hypothetical protein
MYRDSGISRREFLAQVAAGLQVPFAATACGAQVRDPTFARRPPSGPASSGTGPKPLLTPADFTFLGYYDIQTNGATTASAQGLTHRYVDDDLRFLSLQTGGQLEEISLAGLRYSDLITTPTRRWMGIGGMMDFKGFWWEESKQRLWSVAATNYTATIFPTQIFTRVLNDDGTVSDLRGPVSLATIPAKRVFGGVQPVPAWFQSQYGVGPYVVGWGGGTSLVLQGGNASTGPSMYAIPDPANYGSRSTVPSSGFRTIMDYSPADRHRGTRITIPINYMDGGDPRPNPPTAPTGPPVAPARWQSPRADGKGWWTWCDSYWNTGQWIDTQTKHGFVAVLSGFGGKVYYMQSDVHCDTMQFELHIYDPVRFGEVVRGSRQEYAVEPTHMIELDLPGLSKQGHKTHLTPGMGVGGATFDPVTKRLYLIGFGINNFSSFNRLYVFQVNA